MGLANCPQCGKLYVENTAKLCPECYAEEEKAENKVAQFLREVRRKATIDEIQEATAVEHKVILRMMKKGRVFSEFPIEYPCEHCGAPITEGRLCDACSKSILEQFKRMPKATDREELVKSKEGMYTKDFFRK